jgi:hypothetical protein
MNQITVETNETEVAEQQALAAGQAQDVMLELNSSQLMLVGGGCAIIITD